MLRFSQSDASHRGSPSGSERDLTDLTAATLTDLICVSLLGDAVRLIGLVPLALYPRVAFVMISVKAVFMELVPLLLVRRRRVQGAIWLMSGAALTVSVFYIVFSDGLRSSAISLEVGIVTASVVLLGARGAAVFGSIVFLFLLVLAYGQAHAMLPPPIFSESTVVRMVNLMTATTLAAIPAGRAIARLRRLSLKHSEALIQLDAEHRLLRQSEEQLRSERFHLRTILDSEPECVKLISATGVCLDMNPAGLAMVEADSKDQVIGRRVSSLLDPEFRSEFENLHHRVFEGQTQTMKYAITGRRGTHRWLETNVAPLRDVRGHIVAAIAVTRDITSQRMQDSALRESEESFRALFANAPFSAVLMDPVDFNIVGCNHLAYQQLGYTEEEFLKLNLMDIDGALSVEEIRALGALARLKSPGEFETRHRCKNGQLIDVAVWTTPLRVKGRHLVYAAVQNITERKVLEVERLQMTARLRELTGHLQFAREEERKKIAREIHDQLGQQLTGLKMQLNYLFRSGQPLPVEQRAVQEQVEAAIRTVRSIATELRPGVLDSLGLTAAIEWLAQDFQEKHNIPCAIEMHDFRCDEATATTVFRVAQEALTNVARHSHATSVMVVLKQESSAVRLEVIDNGLGIVPSDLGKPGHFGVVGMRERALLAGGTLSVEPAQPGGTRIRLTLPLLTGSVSKIYASPSGR